MAIFDVQLNAISRSDGRSATAAAAYRAGIKIKDERSSETYDYRRKGGVLGNNLLLPSASTWKPTAAELWNAAEQSETRKNSCVAKEWLIAFPCELTFAENEALGLKMAKAIIERYGVAGMLSIHAPSKEGDQRNLHAHFLMSDRIVEGDGFGAKNRILADKVKGPEETKWLRATWAEYVNEALAQSNHSARVDHRSRKEQGLIGLPKKHLGPAQTAMERRGIATEYGDYNRGVERLRQQALALPTTGDLPEVDNEIERVSAEIIDLETERAKILAQNAADQKRREDLAADPVVLLNQLADAIAHSEEELNKIEAQSSLQITNLPTWAEWVEKQPLGKTGQSIAQRRDRLKKSESEEIAAVEAFKKSAWGGELVAEITKKIGLETASTQALDRLLEARRKTHKSRIAYKRGKTALKSQGKDLVEAYKVLQQTNLAADTARKLAQTQADQLSAKIAKAKERLAREMRKQQLTKEQIAQLSFAARLAYQRSQNADKKQQLLISNRR